LSFDPDKPEMAVIRAKVTLVLACGLLINFVLADFFRPLFPISDTALAIWLFPRVAHDLTCLDDVLGQAELSEFPTTYANLAIYMMLLGGTIGFYTIHLCVRLLSGDVQPRHNLAIGRQSVAFAKLTCVAVPLIGACVMLMRSWSFCTANSPGISRERYLGSFYGMTFMGFFSALVFALWLWPLLHSVYNFLRRRRTR